MVNYSLTENLLTERPDDYSAQVQAAQSLDREAVVNRILNRGTLLTKTDILAVLNALEEVVVDASKEGCSVNLPLFNTSFSISGVFESPLDSFDPTRHRFNINVAKGTLLKAAQGEVQLEKVAATSPQPVILEVRDSVSGKANESLTPGGVVEIYGTNIKIAGDDATVGLYFVDAKGGTEIKAATIVQNKPSTLIALIPGLAAGTYTVKVVTQYTGGKYLKVPKSCVYNKTLTVA